MSQDLNTVRFRVNGTDVAVTVEPRMTLADALRQRLRLTGTHLGCEHGVCGACTILIDGRAVRSCLLLAVQMEQAEIVTVEGLGRPDDLHPLQEAFREHHGLQCGFCTPGFLMSSYELLSSTPGLDDPERVAAELSGVLCRCTGYRGIVEAVSAVARDHPDGPPPPRNLQQPIRPVGPQPAAPAEGAAPGVAAGREELPDLVVPEGEPSAVVRVDTEVGLDPETVWQVVSDVPQAAQCLPGAQLERQVAEDIYAGRVNLRIGPMALRFTGAARVLEQDPEQRRLRILGAGRDVGGGSARADITVEVRPAHDGGAGLVAGARLFLTGSAARFGRSLVQDISAQLFADFSRCIEQTARGERVVRAGRPLSAIRLVWHTLRARVAVLWRRLGRRR